MVNQVAEVLALIGQGGGEAGGRGVSVRGEKFWSEPTHCITIILVRLY